MANRDFLGAASRHPVTGVLSLVTLTLLNSPMESVIGHMEDTYYFYLNSSVFLLWMEGLR